MHSHRENSNLRISLFLALFSFASTRSNALSYGDKREFMLIKLDGSFIYWENLRIEETGRECILAFNKNIFRFLRVKLVYLIPNSLFFFYPRVRIYYSFFFIHLCLSISSPFYIPFSLIEFNYLLLILIRFYNKPILDFYNLVQFYSFSTFNGSIVFVNLQEHSIIDLFNKIRARCNISFLRNAKKIKLY